MPEKCIQDEFEANGYFTGQNIDMDYENTALLTEGGATKMRVQFFVPRRYVDQYKANAFAITFNRKQNANVVSGQPDQVIEMQEGDGTVQKACFSNRYDNYTACDHANNNANALWTIDEQNDDNECIMNVHATFDWVDVMGTAFNGRVVKDNGRFTEIFLTATVETWTHFIEGNFSDYFSTMTGSEQLILDGGDGTATNRKGRYYADGGWRGYPSGSWDADAGTDEGDFGPIVMDDERYTLYQIPFIIRFPRTVMVQTSFTVASPLTVLTGLIAQDVILVNTNPDLSTAGSEEPFAVLEAVLTTQVQYPYAIRQPATAGDPDPAGITVMIGNINTAGTHARSVEFIEWDSEASCGAQVAGEMCTQEFKIRIVPDAEHQNGCDVSGQYGFEMWVECLQDGEGGTRGCTLDDKVESDVLATRQQSNAYIRTVVDINHQPWCPVVVDEVRVVGDFRVFHEESFTLDITDTPLTGNQGYGVFTNDVLFYEAAYRTASSQTLGDTADVDFTDNDFENDKVGTDEIIDFVRATKIFMDVTIGKTSDGAATDGWDGSDWDSNFDFTGPLTNGNPLGGTRIPGTDFGVTTVADEFELTNSSGDHAAYRIKLCEVGTNDPSYITYDVEDLWVDVDGTPVLQDCFIDNLPIARNFLDFNKVMESKENVNGDDNNIDENEVAFSMRMDERIIPLQLGTDNSFVTVTIQSEVYYKGNRQPTRRLLQTNGGDRRQQHTMQTSYSVYPKRSLSKCNVGEETTQAKLSLDINFAEQADMPSVASSVDWTTGFSTQLESFLGVRSALRVSKLQRCTDKGCELFYEEEKIHLRRRLDEKTYLKVELEIASTQKESAGHTLNHLQDHLVNSKSDIHVRVSALVKGEITDMQVEGCHDHKELTETAPRARGRQAENHSEFEEESSAASLSPALLLLAGLWALRL